MKKMLLLLLLLLLINVSGQNKWQKLNGPIGGCIAGLLSKGDTLIAGTGNAITYKGSVFYSTNKGNNWSKANGKFSKYFIDFVFTNDGGVIGASLTAGLYKTFDLRNWFQIFSNGLEFWSVGKDNNGILFAGTDNGFIYYSTDNGANWSISFNNYHERIVRFLTLKSNRMFAGAIGELFIKDINNPSWSPVNVDTTIGFIYPFSDKNDNVYFFSYPKMYKSIDSGNTWNSVNTNNFFYNNYLYDCIYNNRMIAAMEDETGWPGGGWGMAISDDTGKTWQWNNNGLPPKFSSVGRFAISRNETYVGTESAGVFKSTDYGDSWFSVNNELNAANTSIISFDKDSNLWAACYSNGLYKSTDKGLSWSLKNNGFTNSYIDNIISDSSGVLFSSTDRGTYRSTDKGESWNMITSLFFYYMNKDRLNRIYGLSYGSGLYRTTDQGNTWIRLDQGFINGFVFGFAIDSSNNIYTGTYGGAIYKSTDDGSSWSNVYQSSIQGSEVNKIAIAPNGTIFATNWNEGILRSTDKGLTWTLQKSDNYNPQYYPVNVNRKGVVFAAGSNNTFFSSTDNGDTWNDITDNLAMTTVQDIIFDRNDTMYLATDESVWRSNPDTTVSVKDKNQIRLQYYLGQNYPNPFNPSTTIQFSVMNSGLTKIEVYDILGRRVETLVNEMKQPGNYSITFNAKSITSGVYFYKLEINDYVSVKKMIFLK